MSGQVSPERLGRIMTLIREAESDRELSGLRWGFRQQGELIAEVSEAIARQAAANGWVLSEPSFASSR